MSRWTQAWLSGPPGSPDEPAADAGGQDYPGQRLGLPEYGPGSAARLGPRVLAIVIDWMPCAVAAQLLTNNPAFSALALFAAMTALTIGIAGRTPGHAVAGLRVALLDGRRAGFGAGVIRAGVIRAGVIRTVLLCLVIPPVVYDADGRGLHDRAAGTIVLRTR